MITIKTPEDIAKLRKAGKILAQILKELSETTVEGISTKEIDDKANELCKKYKSVPVFLNYQPYGADRPYPASICVSINDEIVHGIPNERPRILKTGDVVTLDMGISYQNMIVDSATTVGVGKVDAGAQKLMDVTRGALAAGIKASQVGARTGDIGLAIESFVKKNSKFGIAENLGGHGVGYEVHEDPFVPNIGKKGQGPALKPGMVIAVEPIINEGTPRATMDSDGYTYRTADGKRSAQFEHTIVITEKGPEILTVL
ncbi:MAG: type I methionyl aminopeptidase [Candidatus Pacebacteria bacterium]|nr:type I methionyl aminopeptidase [Candidatus Paceibacterota bacterium]